MKLIPHPVKLPVLKQSQTLWHPNQDSEFSETDSEDSSMTQQRSSDIWVLLKKVAPFLHPPSPWTFAPAITETLYLSPALPVSQRHLNSLAMEKISDILLHQASHHVKSFYNIRFRFSYKLLFSQINWNWINFLDILSPGTSCGSLPSQPAQQSSFPPAVSQGLQPGWWLL